MTIARAHDDRLLDAISLIAPTDYDRTVFRVVREGRAPLGGSRGAGRWNPADLSVLYCSEAREGARAEMHFHLSRGQPVFPSRMRHNLWTLGAALKTTLRLLDIDQLVALGVETARYRDLLYNRTQEIAAAAAFLEYDGLIAPSARHACANLVVFLDNAAPGALTEIACEPVDWAAYVGSRA